MMKVTVCPICRVTPEITNTKLTCPKCGRTAVGEYLEDTVTRWNAGIVTNEKVTKEVIKDEAPEVEPKEENREEIEDEIKEEPKKSAPKKATKPVEKAPVKKTTKRGMR